MPRSLLLPAALLGIATLLSACSDKPAPPVEEEAPPVPTEEERSLSGIWQHPGADERLLILDESQQLHLIGFDGHQGHRWHANEDTLRLETVVRSTGMPRYQQAGYTLDTDTLTLASDDEQLEGTWQRNADAAVRLHGRVSLPDDYGMPADAVLAITLEEQDVDGLPAQILRRQLSRPAAGAESMDYRFYLPPAQLQEHPQARLAVRVLVDGALQYLGYSQSLADVPAEASLDIALKALSGATNGVAATPVRTLHGEYVYFADAALFTECATGRRYPVAYSEGGAELERAYLSHRKTGSDGMPLPTLMTVTGTVQEGPGAEEGTIVEQLFVQTLERTVPEANCATRGTADLENTYWKLTHLASRRISTPENQREAHLVLHSAESQARGNLGCNRFTGSYQRDGDKLTFGNLASTEMACLGGMNVEGDFSAALAGTQSTRIDGETLYLLNARGNTLAQLQAIYLY